MKRVKDEEPLRVFFLLLLIFICYSFILKPLGLFKVVALRVNDIFSLVSHSRRPLPEELKDITIVTIDNDSFENVDEVWPWKRSTFARLINNISSFGPKAIFIDFTFSSKSDDSEDLALAQAIKNSGKVILAAFINEEGRYIKPQAAFVEAAAACGIINKSFIDEDLKVRNMRAVTFVKNKKAIVDFAAEIKTLCLDRGIPFKDIRYEGDKIILSPDSYIPVDVFGTTPISYAAFPGDFISIPGYKFLKGLDSIDGSLLKDKIVLIGMTAGITHDIHPTPLGYMPGIYINANSLLMLLSSHYIKSLPPLSVWNMALFFLVLFLIGILSLRLKPLYSTIFLFILLSAVSVWYVDMQVRYNLRMDIFSLLFLSAASFIGVQVYKYASLIIASERLKGQAVMDIVSGVYTQRYFQMSVQAALESGATGRDNFFCLLHIIGFSGADIPQDRLHNVLKAVFCLIKKHSGAKPLIARYGEDSFSFVARNASRKRIGPLLASIIEEIKGCEFIINNESLKLSVVITAVNFTQPHITKYEDLVLTAEALISRLPEGAKNQMVIFDPKSDKVVSSQETESAESHIPKDELGYVSMDLKARNKELEENLQRLRKQEERINQLYLNTLHSLVKALEEKDPYTAGHSERVDVYSTQLAKGLNLPEKEIELIHKAAYVHDVGKIGLPDRILYKKERLDDNEFALIKRHQADGAKILEGLPFFEDIVPYVLHHHERYDGKGYPHGLRGDMIPRGAQIIAIADSFDAMTTGRGYNSPLTIDEAIAELKKSSATQFNPAYVNTFIELIMQGKIYPHKNP